MNARRVRASGWPYVIAAVALPPLVAWAFIAREHEVQRVQLPTSTTIGVSVSVPTAPPSTLAVAAEGPLPAVTSTTATTTSALRTGTVAVHAADTLTASVLAARLQRYGWSIASRDSVAHEGPTRIMVLPGFETAGERLRTDLSIGEAVTVVDGLTTLDPRSTPDILLIIGAGTSDR